MQFKYPKKIKIGSTLFLIRYNKDHNGASLSYPDGENKAFIEFGMRGHKNNPLRYLELVIHELKEIIQIEQSTRYQRGGSGYTFIYTHDEHEDLCGRLAGLLSKFIK